ncbi:hypothetical protein K491DRAFT_773447 [Lophiostoma macrostomum CBS 122681]|uniref:Uncharacterized protein n=1 Tax=Lophiostoma macrostomum CBS 122681 TaxID=1314788 RepID=A0A6A6TPZ0_9PLEO|nr:hypothetical protein K491DRAFT_773447 [Lophiostoma macrostomum CBS 122681]
MHHHARCCCGSEECAFLAHNSSLLEGLERDVSKAAQLGQALLVRHEAYVADSERERRHMTATIENLEQQKVELEQQNAQTIKTNRDLLDQLEQLNEAVATSDAQVKALTDTLHSTEEEIQRLSSLAARTQALEQQLLDLEQEQARLHSSLDATAQNERTAIQRWRRADRIIADLQDQIDRIEKEAREERERHVEIVARMERRLAVEGELSTAAGRLKAKAGHEKGGTGVVSHFVKDIMLDNANLQTGIVELREMLLNSNEEVERLREQLRIHQPVSPGSEDVPTPTNLKNELGSEPVFNQELHIHHHYHAPAPKKEAPRTPAHRRPKKKRHALTPGHFSPMQPDSASANAILSHTAVTIPPNVNRWSNATTLAPTSLPGSPLSTSHRDSIYDRVFSDSPYDSSRPTSPSDSINLSSPLFGPSKYLESIVTQDDLIRHRRKKSQSLKPPSLSTIRSSSTPISLTAKSSPATAIISAVSPQNSLVNDVFTLSPSLHSAIPEENEDTTTPESYSLTSPDPEEDDVISPTTYHRPALRRAASHESLISVSGMDIHTLQSRPSQLLLSSSPRFSSPAAGGSIQPELTPWTATATASMSRRNLDSSTLNRSLLYGSLVNQQRGTPSTQKRSTSAGLGKKVGGWVFGKWGATPASSNLGSGSGSGSRPDSSSSGQSGSTVEGPSATIKQPKAPPVKLRPPGINQSGPIWGFFDAVPPTPAKVVVTDLDAEALGEALAE